MVVETTRLLSVYDFGHQLLEINDLDPVYVLLWEAKLAQDQLHKWLLAYWCYYHVGTASWCVDQRDYWVAMTTVAGSKDYPRAHERRHFRGASALKSVAWLKTRGIETLFEPLVGKEWQLEQLIKYVSTWYQFGKWIAFKVADMLERLGLAKVDFKTGADHLFDSPRRGAELLWSQERGTEVPSGVTQWAIDRVLTKLNPAKSPPRYERLLNAQEAETIICKFKSYRGGHYHIGEDVTACRTGLLRFARCPTSQELLRAGRRGGLWQ